MCVIKLIVSILLRICQASVWATLQTSHCTSVLLIGCSQQTRVFTSFWGFENYKYTAVIFYDYIMKSD